jgi:hypothetical protein
MLPAIPALNSAWQKYSTDLTAYEGKNATFRFRSDVVRSNAFGAFLIGTFTIETPVAICDDGIKCTQDTCSAATPGCTNNASPPSTFTDACSNLYPASCFSKSCNASNPSAGSDGCVVTANDASCSDGYSCTEDKCVNNQDKVNNGCTHIANDTVCYDGSNCTYDICNTTTYSGSSTGCGNPSSCDDGIK